MHQEQIRRIRKPWFEYSDVEHQTRILSETTSDNIQLKFLNLHEYQRETSPRGFPLDKVLCLSLNGFSRRLPGCEALRMLEELRIRILLFEIQGFGSGTVSYTHLTLPTILLV